VPQLFGSTSRHHGKAPGRRPREAPPRARDRRCRNPSLLPHDAGQHRSASRRRSTLAHLSRGDTRHVDGGAMLARIAKPRADCARQRRPGATHAKPVRFAPARSCRHCRQRHSVDPTRAHRTCIQLAWTRGRCVRACARRRLLARRPEKIAAATCSIRKCAMVDARRARRHGGKRTRTNCFICSET